MNPEPSTHSHRLINPYQNKNSGKENGSEEVGDERCGVVRKISGYPPEEQSEPWEEERNQKKPNTYFMYIHNA
jgi:hypothetical protein